MISPRFSFFSFVAAGVFALCGDASAQSQTLTGKLGEMEPPSIGGMGMKPSISLDVNVWDTLEQSDGRDGYDLSMMRFRTPLFGKKIGDSVISSSFRYTYADVDSEFLGQRDLHMLSASLQWTRRPENDAWFSMLRAEAGVGFESGADVGDSLNYRVMGIGGYRLSDTLMLGAGFYSRWDDNESEFVFYPSVGIIWQATPDLYVQITPPLINIAWQASPKWVFFINSYPTGGEWVLDGEQAADELEIQLFTASVGVEYRFNNNVRLNVRAGTNFISEVEVRDSEQRVLRGSDLDSAIFGAVTVSWVF